MGLRIAIIGYGKMGRSIERLAPEHRCEVVRIFCSPENANGVALNRDSLSTIDVAIEFTTSLVAPQNLRRLIEAGVPVVTGTTGWLAELPQIRELTRCKNGGVVCGPNFSVGLHHFRATVAEAARRFACEEAYGAWGWEMHHAAKKDSPSGTLLALAEDISRSGYARAISLSANRAGAVPGTHEIGFDSAEDTITLRHTAHSRDGFARGALRAARWLAAGKKGFFEFREIVDELP
jgi:4-hydroxy-tetrahydrodipicolinate reductase